MRVYNRLNVPMNGKTMQPKMRMSFANGRFVINPEACRVMDLFHGCHINIYYHEQNDIWLIGKADETGFLLRVTEMIIHWYSIPSTLLARYLKAYPTKEMLEMP